MSYFKMKLIHFCCFLLMVFAQVFSINLWAQKIQLDHNGLALNATLNQDVTALAGRRVFLLLHGTLGHNKMEIMHGLLNTLQEEDEVAMAITLSLGIDDRSGSFDCDAFHNHRHQDAKLELSQWLNWLVLQNVSEVVLIGHSRGAIQVADFLRNNESKLVSAAVLIAPPQTTKQLADEKIADILDTPSDTTHHTVDSFLHCNTTTVSALSLQSYYGERPDDQTLQTIQKLTLPIMMILGTQDPVANPKLWKKQDELPENVNLMVINGADHFFRDLYLYEIVEGMLEWLDQ